MNPSTDSGSRIRNFCIIAHIDHGKSTLADRLIEITQTIQKRHLKQQMLDTMDLEQERGITIKAQAVKMRYTSSRDGQEYVFNLIDTPGHVDFNYEVSRSLAACEGAILLVDASQGIEAQTISNVYLALDADLEILPVVNKIDLDTALVDDTIDQIQKMLGVEREAILGISAKSGLGVPELAETIIEKFPPPKDDHDAPLRSLIFDCKYDTFKGIIAYTRIVEGKIESGDKLRMLRSGSSFEATEIGFFSPDRTPQDILFAGEVGYVATGLKDVSEVRVGDTLVHARDQTSEPLPGYKSLKPTVFTGVYPIDSEQYQELRVALSKLRLNDASLVYEAESSSALGFGFRCGFLGMLHMEIIQERLAREYQIEILNTSPSVRYRIALKDGTEKMIENPSKMPPVQSIATVYEPWTAMSIVSPERYLGGIMKLIHSHRGEQTGLEYLQLDADGQSNKQRVMLSCNLPMAEILIGFYDSLKSVTSGYGSMDYQIIDDRPSKLVKMEVLVNAQPVDSLSMLIDKSKVQYKARELAAKLKELIPRQMFEVPIQVAVGSKIVARENIKALRKNVLAKCYGGDVTRKKKLLEKQAAGKKRMKQIGRVGIPQEAFMAILKIRS